MESQFSHPPEHSVEARREPARPLAREQEAGADADRQDAEQMRQLTVVDEPCTSGTDLERTNRRHASTTTATQAGWLRVPFGVVRLVAGELLAAASQPTSATRAGSEPEGDLRDGDHGHVAMPNRLMVDVADAEVSLEELRNRLGRGGSGRH
jgi:hypothetical protein